MLDQLKRNNIKVSPSLFLMAGLFIGTIFLYMWFLESPHFQILYDWSQKNLATLIPTLIVVKTIGIIWPPLPGGFATIAMIPLTGVIWAYTADLIGTIIGCSTAYFLGRKYGKDFLAKLLGEDFAEQSAKLKIKEGREFEALFVLRLLGAGVLVEAISYGAGLIKMSFTKFLIGTVVSHVIIVGISYYLYSILYKTQNIYIVALSLVITLPLLWKVKGRYFEDVMA